MAVSKSDLKFYLTTIDAGNSQTNPSQSLGGHVSSTLFGNRTTLSANLSPSDTLVSFASTMGSSRVLIGNEIVSVNSGTIIGRGQLDTLKVAHFSGTPVLELNPSSLFNDSFSNDLIQYRCIAVRNENATNNFLDMSFYLKKPSRNSSTAIAIAVEYAKQTVTTGTATRGGSISLTDTSIIGTYDDNLFSTCSIIFTSGTNINVSRVINSFDSATGVIVFTSSLVEPVAIGDTYRIGQLPSQRIVSGKESPEEIDNMSQFYTDNTQISIDIDSERDNGTSLKPWETVYLWFKRQGNLNAEEYVDNRVIFTARYKTA